MSAAALGLCAVFAAVLVTKPFGPDAIRIFDDVFLTFAAASGSLAAFAASRRLHRSRTSWRYIGFGAGLWALGQAYWTVVQNVANVITPVPSPADAAFVVSTLIIAVGVARFPSGTAWATARGLLDSGIVGISLGYVGWSLIPVHAPTNEAVLALAYPATNIFLAATIILALARTGAARSDFRILLVAAASKVVVDGVYVVLLSRQEYETGHLADIGWALWLGLTVVAADRAADREEYPVVTARPAVYVLAPYGAVLAALITRVWSGATGRPLGGIALAAVVVIVALLLARHAVAVLENERLATGLRQQVEDLRRANAAHRKSEELLEAVLQGLPGGAYTAVIRPSKRLLFASNGLADLCGYAVEELLEKADSSLVDERDRAHVAAHLQRAESEGQASFRYRIIHRDGTRRWVENRARRTADDEQVVLNGFIADITEEVEAARQAEQSRRMDAVGRFASVVAHDFNNILTVLKAHVSFAKQALQDGGALEEDLVGIERATQRATTLASQLLSLGTTQSPESAAIDVSHALALLKPALAAVMDGVEFRLDTRDAGLAPHVRIDPEGLERVALNLCLNARDAGRASGRPDPSVVLRLSDEGRHVALHVIDNGTGMDAETQERCLDPFFTTKLGGSGLGLASVAAIVAETGGTLTIDSTIGAGTRVTAVFPTTSPYS